MRKKITKFKKKIILQLLKIRNLLILWLNSKNKWIDPKKIIRNNLLSDRETLLLLKKNPKLGIIRNGNSELGVIVGNSPQTQKYDKQLKDILVNNFRNYNSITSKRYVLALPLEALIVGYTKRNIPNWYPGTASRWAMRFLVKKNQIYGSPFCFRVTEVLDNDMKDYLNLIKSLFVKRKIIYVGPMEKKNAEIPIFIRPSEIIKIPDKNAFIKFEEIVMKIKKVCKNYQNPLVVIVGGTTASAISYELNMSGVTCYDFGQYNRLYKKYLLNKNNS